MKTIKLISALCLTVMLQLGLASCSKEDSDKLLVSESSLNTKALNQFQQTTDFGKLSNMFGLNLTDVQVTNLSDDKNLRILTLPFKTTNDKIKFAAVYVPKDSGFNSNAAKILIFEISSSDKKDVKKAIETKQFTGELAIFNIDNRILYSIKYEQNQVVTGKEKMPSDIATQGEGRGSACSADGIGYCTGAKMESRGTFEKIACFVDIVICAAVYAADCALENCPEQELL